MEYKFQLNLQSMCLVKVAIGLWEQRSIQNLIKIYTMHRMQSQKNEKKWNILTSETLKMVDKLHLPSSIKDELKYIVYCTGLRIIEWVKFLRCNISMSFCCQKLADFEKFCWTHYGTIDKVKTFLFWLEKDKLEMSDAFNMACSLCLKEQIVNIWQCIPEETKNNKFYTEEIYQDYRYNIIAYWKSYCEDELTDFMDLLEYDEFEIFDQTSTPEKNMFKLCIEQQHNELGVQYFWTKLTDADRSELLTDAFIPIEMVMSFSAQITYDFKVDGCIESVIFILNEVLKNQDASKQLEVILEHKYLILDLLSSTWPWQEYFFITLTKLWDYLTEFEYKNLLKNIIIKMLREYCFENFEGAKNYREILKELWQRTPLYLKESVYFDDDNSIFWQLVNEDNSAVDVIELVCFDETGPNKLDLVKQDDWEGNKLLGLIYNQTVSLLVNGKDVVRFGTEEERGMIQDIITSLSIFELS